ncbi:hypothetical protein F5Y07DRAFT_64999 [Xylaria sp. FL0933]|nr:hypothetical protein F5Y07DRAFT_64999 [Xylaria sp. FL0933]
MSGAQVSEDSVARYELAGQWMLREANENIHIGNQIQVEEDVTQDTIETGGISRNASSTTPDNKDRDNDSESAIGERSRIEEAAESLLQLSRDDTPVPLVKLYRQGGGYGEDSTGSQGMPAKRRRVQGNDSPPKRKERSDDLIFTVSAVHIRRGGGGEAEALSYNSMVLPCTVLVRYRYLH